MQSFEVELLHGLCDAGGVHRRAELREPTGRDQALMTELAGAPPAKCISALIASLTQRIGNCAKPSRDQLVQLTAGDRERLVLAVCARLLGHEADLIVPCPACRDLCEVPVHFADIIALRPSTSDDHCSLQASGESWTARLSPPTGHDLEAVSRGGAGAERQLLESCLRELYDPTGEKVAKEGLPPECETELGEALFALDPLAECRIGIDCPHCAARFDTLLDGFTLLRTAIGDVNSLYGDIYRMARTYHWSEADILALPLRRRRHYLAIAAAQEVRS
jgi:hypothetical protein